MNDIELVKKYFKVDETTAKKLIDENLIDLNFIKNKMSDVIENDVNILKNKIDERFKDIED